MPKCLLLGCGRNRQKQVYLPGHEEWAGELIRVDINPAVEPDFCLDLDGISRLPFDDEAFAEIGAFNSLEHWGRQGDWRGWFAECAEYHRVLEWGGTMHVAVPIGEGALADPGHVRFFHHNHFAFLDQEFYLQNEKAKTNFSDYRFVWDKHFKLESCVKDGQHLGVVIRKERWLK